MLHLVKVPLRVDRLMALAKDRRIRLRDLDEGYLAHCLLTETWQERAPGPFVLRGAGRVISAWGYSSATASALIEHARDFGDPAVLQVFDRLDAIASKEMPVFQAGRRLGFLVRVCPVARLARAINGHQAGAEVDVFLREVFAKDSHDSVARDEVYRSWFRARFRNEEQTGASLESVRIAGMTRTRIVRRSQGEERVAKVLERPDVHLEGDLVIRDGDAFLQFLARGVGRHRAFGFGALLVVPPGTSHSST